MHPTAGLVREDPIVRTGSALIDEPEPDLAVERLEEICGRLRARITEVEISEAMFREKCERLSETCSRLDQDVQGLSSTCSQQESLLTEYKAENARLLARVSQPSAVSKEASAVVATDSQGVSADLQCGRCCSLSQQVERYRHSAAEAKALGAQLGSIADERDRLKNELKRLNQTSERVKIVLKENERLKEALKKRLPVHIPELDSDSTFFPRGSSDRIHELERRLERAEEQSAREVEALRARHEQIRDDYERTILSLRQAQLRQPLAANLAPVVSEETERENAVLRNRVKELEARVESVKQFYQLKQRRTTTGEQLEGPAAVPPVAERDVTLTDWVRILKDCALRRERSQLQSDLLHSDYRKSGFIDRQSFVRLLSGATSMDSAQTLLDIYSAGDDKVAYKTFLSDLATREGVVICDVEEENRALRGHVETLISELQERIETAESGQLEESLQHANTELMRKDDELRVYKAELNRVFRGGSRYMRRVSLGE